eukprot:335405_1
MTHLLYGLFFIQLLTNLIYNVNGNYLRYSDLDGKSYQVTSDTRSWIIDNKRTILIGGSIHPPRLSQYQWYDILKAMVNDGLNHVQIYTFWNVHEPTYNFNGTHIYQYNDRANLTKFLQIAADVGLFVTLRIGPYVCAEWKFGGLPTWLLHDRSIRFRWDNAAWKQYMTSFVNEIINITTPFFAKNGGPIILAQIENEYPQDGSKQYIEWCGELITTLNTSLSWIMCNGQSANDTINTCNANNCYDYALQHEINPNFENYPLAWTENEGWFQSWDRRYNHDDNEYGYSNRPASEIAYTIGLWFAVGAAHMNYYMYCGGNHLSHWAASGITNYYADGVNYHSDMLPNEPKRTHLNRLHYILAEYQDILLADKKQIYNAISLIPVNANNKYKNNTFAYKYVSVSGDMITFLVNMDDIFNYTLEWNNKNYSVPAVSVSIVNNDGIEVYNTYKVNSTGLAIKRIYKTVYNGTVDLQFSYWNEPIPIIEKYSNRTDKPIINQSPLEQIRFTNDSFSEYLYYSMIFNTKDFKINVSNGEDILLEWIGRTANAYSVFIDDIYIGQAWDGHHGALDLPFSVDIYYNIINETKDYILTIISSSLGIDNDDFQGVKTGFGPDEQDKKGIVGYVQFLTVIDDKKPALIMDLTNLTWTHWIGLTGEELQITGNGVNNWNKNVDTSNAYTWYKTEFMTPIVPDGYVLLIDIGGVNNIGFNRGHIWLNGIDLGHYNNAVQQNLMVQQYYFIPKDYLMNNNTKQNNILIFMDEFANSNVENCNIVLSTMVVPESASIRS